MHCPITLPGKRITPRNQHAWRRWLDANHATISEVWVLFYKKAAQRSGRAAIHQPVHKTTEPCGNRTMK